MNAGEAELVTRAPMSVLRGHVRAIHGWSERGAEPVRRKEFSYGDVVLIVNLDAPVRILDPREPSGFVAPRAFVGGVDDRHVVTEHDGIAAGLQISLSPLGARALLGMPLREIAGRVVELEDLLGAAGRELVARLHDEATWAGRFDVLEHALAARIAAAPPPPPDAVRAWLRLRETHGALRIDALAAELGCSRRHLAARFRDQIGLSPKSVARIVRFRHAVRLMLRDAGRWADVAYACGYADQPHLNRDFRQFVGTTPTAYLESAATVTYLQDGLTATP